MGKVQARTVIKNINKGITANNRGKDGVSLIIINSYTCSSNNGLVPF